jgi:hypothetical protein
LPKGLLYVLVVGTGVADAGISLTFEPHPASIDAKKKTTTV